MKNWKCDSKRKKSKGDNGSNRNNIYNSNKNRKKNYKKAQGKKEFRSINTDYQ